ncbi:hypothetical protein [Mesobacillus jeotgali]|uniref:hypothetical protein n=1 Tax=Mesobacillus jeotgali TaxID=129985 RepID=UPI001CFD4913|nr:hypothetical protein [Mesobacillus jeotgali]
MSLAELLVFGIVWGGLMVYFLTPFNNKISSKGNSKVTVSKAFKESLTRLILHKKAILALLMLIITLNFIWSYFISIDDHNKLHGVNSESVKPQAILSMVSLTLYSVLLYILLAVRRVLKFKNNGTNG